LADALTQAALGALATDTNLWNDFIALCDRGGRQAGTTSEHDAIAWAHSQLQAIAPGAVAANRVPYAAWTCNHASVEIEGTKRPVQCASLLGAASTPADGIAGEVLDLGRGTQETFELHAAEIAGRIVLVRHEYPFAGGHIHRRRKYDWARERGAIGFLIANPAPGAGPVSGSSGRGGGEGIPALGIDAESAARLSPQAGRLQRVRLRIEGDDHIDDSTVLVLDLPGRSTDRIALSAHIDGHALGESALDNGSGVAVAIALARAFAPHAGKTRAGLRVCLFSAEEWALAGSREWLERMPPGARSVMKLNVNLDTVAGDGHLTALTSGYSALEPFVTGAATEVGMDLGTHRPMMSNSDHYNFARHGIPALRLVAGFDRPHCNVRHILTGADTRDKAAPGELKAAGLVAGAILARALDAPQEVLTALAGQSS
jgi:aminopeptidase YwaD